MNNINLGNDFRFKFKSINYINDRKIYVIYDSRDNINESNINSIINNNRAWVRDANNIIVRRISDNNIVIISEYNSITPFYMFENIEFNPNSYEYKILYSITQYGKYDDIKHITSDTYLFSNELYNTRLNDYIISDDLKVINKDNNIYVKCIDYINYNNISDVITYIINPNNLRCNSIYSKYQDKSFDIPNIEDYREYNNIFHNIYYLNIIKPLQERNIELDKKKVRSLK